MRRTCRSSGQPHPLVTRARPATPPTGYHQHRTMTEPPLPAHLQTTDFASRPHHIQRQPLAIPARRSRATLTRASWVPKTLLNRYLATQPARRVAVSRTSSARWASTAQPRSLSSPAVRGGRGKLANGCRLLRKACGAKLSARPHRPRRPALDRGARSTSTSWSSGPPRASPSPAARWRRLSSWTRGRARTLRAGRHPGGRGRRPRRAPAE